MTAKPIRRLLALIPAVILLASACGCSHSGSGSGEALVWCTWNGYEQFLELAAQAYPDIELEFTPYMGANRTGYSWAQMRADDIPDIFITSQILDSGLAEERLIDLSGYSFINDFSTSILDQVAIDGGVYLLPVNNAMYGIFYNKTLMEEHGWQVPSTFAELEALCGEIREAGLIPGVVGTHLTGGAFSAVLNLAKTSWLTTPEGVSWERDFLSGSATAEGMWEGTMDYVQKYIDIGMFTPDPKDRNNVDLILDYLGNRKSVFFTTTMTVNITELPDTGDKLGIMPYISQNGSKNIYMCSPTSYIGLSKRLTQPGNEKKLENAVKLLSLLFSPEGQAAFITDQTPCLLSVLGSAAVVEDSLIYDAKQALQDGRAFPMTYAGWEGVLADMGQAYKDWFRGVNGMDGPKCIARMDELQSGYLNNQETVYFCQSTADFTIEETARLVGKALGSAVGADAAIIPYDGSNRDSGGVLTCGVTGKLYQDRINSEVSNSICPGSDGEYALLTMTGAQAKELAAAGFDMAGSGSPFPYVLVTRSGGELEDGGAYQVAFLIGSYTEEAGLAYSARIEKGSVRTFLRNWLTEQKTASPGGNPWE